jgi:hypothetical protein
MKSESAKAELNTDSQANWIAKIVEDPTDVPSLILMFGFVGKASKEDHIRIYLNPMLNCLSEIPKDAIIHQQDVSGPQFPLGGTFFWIATREASRILTYQVAPQPQSNFSTFGKSLGSN